MLPNILAKKRIDYKRMDVEVSSVRNPKKATRMELLTINVAIQTGTENQANQAEKNAGLVLKNCGMIHLALAASTSNIRLSSRQTSKKR